MKNLTSKIFYTCLTMILLVNCSVAQPGHYTSSHKKAIKLYEEGRSCFNDISPQTGKRNLDCAEEALLKALEKDPEFVEAHMMLSNVYIERKDFAKAIAQKETMFALGKPVSHAEYFYMASMNMAIGDYEKCLKYANIYIKDRNANQEMVNKAYRYIDNCNFAIEAKKHPVAFEPINMGPNINSERPEYFPSITADDKQLLYTRDVIDPREINYGHQEEILVAESESPHEWTLGKSVSPNINTVYNEGAPTFSADGKYIIMVGCEVGYGDKDYGADRQGYGSCDLFVSEKIGKEWTKPSNMGAPINSAHWETQPSFSSDGKTLYFIRGAMSKQTGGKHQDIYVSEITASGWSKPERLPDYINTPGKEESVQIHPDGQTLYFTSDGHIGMGGTDIYMCRMQADGTWGKPVNLGYPINTHMDENSLLVSSKGDIAYFASDREGGYGSLDLYRFKLPKEYQPIKTTYMKGFVYDSISKEPLAADFQLFDLKTGQLYKRAIANSGNGEFLVAIPTNKDFGVIAEHENYLYFSQNFSLDELEKTEEGFIVNVPMQPIKTGSEIVLKNIFFDVDKSDLKPESIPELEKLKDFLTKNSSIKIELGGHTDSDGDDAHNMTLSKNRAKAVKDWLIKHGIDESRLTHKGYGETEPIRPNDTPENKALNRRTVAKIL
ncbi:OmpA family protein [Parvicella tangerina]|uniref:Peptidoglycan-associated lipoprotein n=1 Tax=Parvicella tangerina TaxID=2829795 RepID=A0A916JK23_9FLAO|nr:OmpA family protein [Parvicella tangerina]CAG5078641.1 Peptidoglycan-associated lipoprotein [Parvicella tangerina]